MSRSKASGPENDAGDVQISLDKNGHPDEILVVCDFECSIDICSRKFMVSAVIPEENFLISRPILLQENAGLPGNRHVIPFKPENTHRIQRGLKPGSIMPSHPYHPVLQVQIEIMESRGKIFRIMEYLRRRGHSPAAFSDKFRKAAGITLKSFADKIRLCHALWDLMANREPIKSIALDFGYDPISFSLRFFKTFNIWPSEVRKTAGSPSEVLKNHFHVIQRERERERERECALKNNIIFSKIILCVFS